jgi:hypothetical protein
VVHADPLEKWRPLVNRGEASYFLTMLGGEEWVHEIKAAPGMYMPPIWNDLSDHDLLYLVPFLKLPPGLRYRVWGSWLAMDQHTRERIIAQIPELIDRALATIKATDRLAAESRAEVAP